MRIKDMTLVRSRAEMREWPEGKFLIDTVNAHSFVVAQRDPAFADALLDADALLPDGISIVKASRWLRMQNAPDEKIAGADLFAYEMEKLNAKGGTCFFLGSSPKTLAMIEEKAKTAYPNIRVVTYSPPYKAVFTAEESQSMVDAVKTAEILITVTGCKDIVRKEHLEVMRDGCIMGNVGHFDNEISKKDLNALSKNVTRVREFVDEYEMKDGRKIYLISDGRLMNLAAGQGHPAEIMDMSFAVQALGLEYMVKNHACPASGVL